jgi:hypothetical protein
MASLDAARRLFTNCLNFEKKRGFIMKTYELRPADGRKSFYGKCYVREDSDGTETLYSYNTPIIRREPNGKMHRLWWGWSATTGRHIRAFCGMNKAEFTALPA